MPDKGIDTVTIERLQIQGTEELSIDSETSMLDLEPGTHSMPEIDNDWLHEEKIDAMIHKITDRVRTSRNNKIKLYSEKHVVLEYFRQHHAFELSNRKFEFLSRELNELQIAPVDLVHYSAGITRFKESATTPALDQQCDQLVMQELVKIFNKYTF